MPDRQVWSVSQVNLFIKNLLDETPQLSGLLVRGELSNYKVYPSGHHYFTLKDSEGAMRCVMFRGAASKLRFRPENGMQVIVSGRVGVYPRDGEMCIRDSAAAVRRGLGAAERDDLKET